MRRPLKPFVTEYRGGSRRQAAGSQAPKPDLSNIQPEPPAVEQRSVASSRLAESQEDTYEAALRAADALFSTRPTPAPAQAKSPAESSSPASHPAGGRVLRVLDEPESPEMARLEAERAPKRRGRKPGSKNKPKFALPAVTQDEVVVKLAQETVPPPVLAVAQQNAIRALPVVARAVAAETPRGGERYAWVRTKLKPGQQWKRRLPKVAW